MSWYDASLKEADARIAWVLAHPSMSVWLKEALRAALERDPVDILNDLEILNYLLRARSDLLIHNGLNEVIGNRKSPSADAT